MGDRVERLLEVHKAPIKRLLVFACFVHQYSEIRNLISCPPSLSESRLQFPFRCSLGSFPVWSEEGTSFARETPVSQIATHILCILSSAVSPPSLNSSAGTSATCCLTDGMCNLRTKWWSLLLPILFVQLISLPHHGTSLHNTLSILRFVQLQSNFRELLTGYIADKAETFESSSWLSGSAGCNLLLSSLLLIPCTCLPAAAVYPLWAFFVPLPSAPDIGFYLCLLLLSFPWLLRKSHQISISFSFATWRI